MDPSVAQAVKHFQSLFEGQLRRVEAMKATLTPTDFASVRPLVVGVVPGDGIGPVICRETVRVLQRLLRPDITGGCVRFRTIEGLTFTRPTT